MTAIVFGGSGLTGKALVTILLNSSEYNNVVLFLRKKIEGIENEKLTQHVIDFNHLNSYTDLIKGDVLFHCLGTTIKKAGSQEMFTKIDFEYPSIYASIAKNNGVKKLIAISSLGVKPNSKNFYIKTKANIESKFKELKFDITHIVRPSLLLGERKENRLGENIGAVIMKALSFILIGKLKRYRAIKIENLALKLYKLSLETKSGYFIHESETIEMN